MSSGSLDVASAMRVNDRMVLNQMPSNQFLAHVRRNDDGSFAIHDLEEHLRAVGDLAGDFASSFDQAEWGRLARLRYDFRGIA